VGLSHAEDRGTRPICDYENSTYRTDFWEGRGREYEDLVERLALRRLLPAGGRRILDIGAGFGRLADMYDGYEQVVLLDYSRSQLEYARSRLGDERFVYVAADLYRLPLATNAVDTTVMVRVLHHIADVPCALQQIQRATCPQGTFILEFANKRHLKNILRYAVRRGVNPFDPQPYEFADLHFDFHPDWVMERLGEQGFQVQQRLSLSLFRMGLLKRLFPARLLASVDGALQRSTAALAPAPSVMVRSQVAKAGEPQVVGLQNLFRCPNCGQEPLQPAAEAMACDYCGTEWPIVNGVYLFK
jgi:SAM-dependent methyltransferase